MKEVGQAKARKRLISVWLVEPKVSTVPSSLQTLFFFLIRNTTENFINKERWVQQSQETNTTRETATITFLLPEWLAPAPHSLQTLGPSKIWIGNLFKSLWSSSHPRMKLVKPYLKWAPSKCHAQMVFKLIFTKQNGILILRTSLNLPKPFS